MSEPGDLQAPAWLQRNWQPKEPFDPTPWLQERYRRQVEQAKLPLELQGMELRNKAFELDIEHQGVINDQLNQELNIQAAELPAYRAYMEQVANTPGGALTVKAPGFQAAKYIAGVANRMKLDADTLYGKALSQTVVSQQKNVADWMPIAGRTIQMRPDGTFDPDEYAKLGADYEAKKVAKDRREAQDKVFDLANAHVAQYYAEAPMREQEMATKAYVEAYYKNEARQDEMADYRIKAQINQEFTKDTASTFGKNIADLKQKERNINTLLQGHDVPLAWSENEQALIREQQHIQDQIAASESFLGARSRQQLGSSLVTIGGARYIQNNNTGSMTEISDTRSKFIEHNIPKWMEEYGFTAEVATQKLGETWDMVHPEAAAGRTDMQNLGKVPGVKSPTAPPPPTQTAPPESDPLKIRDILKRPIKG